MPIKIIKRGSVYHYTGTVAGRRLRGSCKTADKEIAQRVAARIEGRAWKRDFDGPGAVLTFAQAAMLYRDADKPTRFLDTVEDYWRDTLVKDITSAAVKRAALSVLPRHSNATRNRHFIVPTQAVINHAAEAELCSRLFVKRFPVATKECQYADWNWVEAFMAQASPHLGALACFMFLTGARIGEAVAMTWAEVDLGNRRALIRQTKVGRERWANLPPPLVAAMANLEGRSGRVFGYKGRQTPVDAWKAAIRRAGIKPLTFHACRHGFATAMLRAGYDVKTVAKAGGWATPALVLSTYGHAIDDPTITDDLVKDWPKIDDKKRQLV